MWQRNDKKKAPPPPLEPQRENRYVYGGDREPAVSGYAVRTNRHGVRKRMSTFNFIIGLFAIGTLVVLYINNTIAVDELTGEIEALHRKKQRQLDMNAAKLAEVNQKSSLQRVGPIAKERLGMEYPREKATLFEVPADLRERAAEVRREFPE